MAHNVRLRFAVCKCSERETALFLGDVKLPLMACICLICVQLEVHVYLLSVTQV